VQACLRTGDLNAAETLVGPLLPMELPAAQRALTLFYASWVAAERGDHDGERAFLAAALPLAEAIGGRTLCRTLVGVAWAQANAREFEAARHSAERGLAIATAAGDPYERGRGLMTIAAVTRLTCEYAESERYLHDAIALATEIGDLELENSARGNLGVLHHLNGDATGSIDAYRAAEECYLAELEISRQLGIRQQLVVCHANLAQLYLRLGRPEETGPHLEIATRGALEFGLFADLGICLVVEAERRLLDGDVDEALMLIGALNDDPRTGENDAQEIDRFLARADLDDEVVRVGMQRGEGRDFVELCREFLPAHPDATAILSQPSDR